MREFKYLLLYFLSGCIDELSTFKTKLVTKSVILRSFIMSFLPLLSGSFASAETPSTAASFRRPHFDIWKRRLHKKERIRRVNFLSHILLFSTSFSQPSPLASMTATLWQEPMWPSSHPLSEEMGMNSMLSHRGRRSNSSLEIVYMTEICPRGNLSYKHIYPTNGTIFTLMGTDFIHNWSSCNDSQCNLIAWAQFLVLLPCIKPAGADPKADRHGSATTETGIGIHTMQKYNL